MQKRVQPATPWGAPCAAALIALWVQAAGATPVAISNAGYWLETVGPNTIGLAGGGVPSGVITTLFVANTSPTGAAGTTATANFSGAATNAPTFDSSFLWARRVLNPSAAQLQPLTVVFQNGVDTASFTGRSLAGVVPMPLVQNLSVDASANAFSPTINWVIPSTAGVEINAVQLVFYSNLTDAEIGTRVLLAPNATSFTYGSTLAAAFDLVVNVRLVDLANNAGALTSDNILSESRAYINYVTPVPEPSSAWLLTGGLLVFGLKAVRRRTMLLAR